MTVHRLVVLAVQLFIATVLPYQSILRAQGLDARNALGLSGPRPVMMAERHPGQFTISPGRAGDQLLAMMS